MQGAVHGALRDGPCPEKFIIYTWKERRKADMIFLSYPQCWHQTGIFSLHLTPYWSKPRWSSIQSIDRNTLWGCSSSDLRFARKPSLVENPKSHLLLLTLTARPPVFPEVHNPPCTSVRGEGSAVLHQHRLRSHTWALASSVDTGLVCASGNQWVHSGVKTRAQRHWDGERLWNHTEAAETRIQPFGMLFASSKLMRF